MPQYWLLIAITFAGAALRLIHFDTESFWFDEMWTALVIRGGYGDTIHFLRYSDKHPPLYFLFLKTWALMSDSDMSLRLFSTVFSIASIPLITTFVTPLGGRAAGLLAAALLAINPLHIWYAREARSYSFLFFLCLVSLIVLFDVISKSSRPRWFVWALLTAAIMYTHYLGAFFIISEFAVVLLLRNTRAGVIKEFCVSSGLSLVIFLPWLFPFVDHATSVERRFWIPAPTVSAVLTSLCNLVSNSYETPDNLRYWIGYWVASPFYVAALLLPLISRKRNHVALTLLVLVPVLGELLVSLQRPIFYTPSLVPVILPLLALTSIAIMRLPRVLVPSAIILLSFAIAPRASFYMPRKQDWRGITQLLSADASQGELIFVEPAFAAPALQVYGEKAEWRKDVVLEDHASVVKRVMNQETPGPLGAWIISWHYRQPIWFDDLRRVFKKQRSYSIRNLYVVHLQQIP